MKGLFRKGKAGRPRLAAPCLISFRKKAGDILFIIPALVLIAVFLVGPAVESVYLSFFSEGKFVGFQNYIRAFSDRAIVNVGAFLKGPPWGAVVNNLVWIVAHLPVTVILGLGLALLLRNVKGASVIKSVIFFFFFVPMVIGGVLVRFMFSKSAGLLSNLFGLLGIERLHVTWTARPETALASLILTSVWLWTGYSLLVYSAGLTTIPKEVIEAAEIDGASAFKRFRYIILPLLRSATRVVVIMTMLWELKLFDLVYTATMGGPGKASTVLPLEIYFAGFRYFDYGRASALATVLTLFTMIPLMFMLRGLGRHD